MLRPLRFGMDQDDLPVPAKLPYFELEGSSSVVRTYVYCRSFTAVRPHFLDPGIENTGVDTSQPPGQCRANLYQQHGSRTQYRDQNCNQNHHPLKMYWAQGTGVTANDSVSPAGAPAGCRWRHSTRTGPASRRRSSRAKSLKCRCSTSSFNDCRGSVACQLHENINRMPPRITPAHCNLNARFRWAQPFSVKISRLASGPHL